MRRRLYTRKCVHSNAYYIVQGGWYPYSHVLLHSWTYTKSTKWRHKITSPLKKKIKSEKNSSIFPLFIHIVKSNPNFKLSFVFFTTFRSFLYIFTSLTFSLHCSVWVAGYRKRWYLIYFLLIILQFQTTIFFLSSLWKIRWFLLEGGWKFFFSNCVCRRRFSLHLRELTCLVILSA